MSKVTIYRFRVYDIGSDGMKTSRRWGTRKAIEQIARGEVLEDTAVEVEADAVESNIPGLTERDFDPDRCTGFQRVVRPG
jgi:hypothetical protein